MIADLMMFEHPPVAPVSSYLMDESDGEGDWLAPLDGDGADQPSQGAGTAADIRRISSAPAMHFAGSAPGTQMGWDSGSTAPLPIRPTRRAGIEFNDYSSLESSQSLLGGCAGSYSDDSAFPASQQHAGGFGTHLASHHFGSAPHLRQCVCGGALYGAYHHHAAPLQPQDALAAIELAASMGAAPVPMSAPAGSAQQWVPMRAKMQQGVPGRGPLPLPVPSSLDMELAMLDDVDFAELADALQEECVARKVQMQRSVGSCPLPTLLEDALSGDGTDGSDDTMHRSYRGSGNSYDQMERCNSGTLSFGSAGRAPPARSPRRAAPIPIPRHSAGAARTSSLKPQRLSRTPSNSSLAASAAMAAAAATGGLASSYPTTDRPVRSAARRSLAVTAAALRDVDIEDDPESDSASDGGQAMAYDTAARRPRGTAATAGAAASAPSRDSHKKKHNPWSIEETSALVEGVRVAGVGKWAEIKRLGVNGIADLLASRTAVDLKDKWRNLTRVARLPKASLKQRLQRGPSDVPFEIMLVVKELMDASQDE